MPINKITGVSVVLLAVIIVGGILGYLGIVREKSELGGILDVEMPMEQSVREIEVSMWETTNAIFYYMLEPSAISLEEYKKQLKDIEEFVVKYKALINTEKEKKILEKFEKKWADSVSKAEELIRLRDKMEELHEKAWDMVGDADDIIDYKIQPAFMAGVPDLIEKEKAVREVEVSIWEAISATNYYLYRQFDKPKRVYHSQLADVDEFWGNYKKLSITPSEQAHIDEFENEWSRSRKLMEECHALADELKKKYLIFWESAHAADDIIDFDIQEHLKKRIEDRRK
ncbi:MAG: MCP four helix bundle domain-containing protein [Omnitrophica bacterium]|nr:MCP four helix bundle domain-containing protein [Candidatus Omnitrophota bacterium]